MGVDTLKIRWLSLTGGYRKPAEKAEKKDAATL
jgi:hypothetical protein